MVKTCPPGLTSRMNNATEKIQVGPPLCNEKPGVVTVESAQPASAASADLGCTDSTSIVEKMRFYSG